MTQARLQDISHVLLDIEGTTCPVSFVSQTLFPYARRQLSAFLEAHQQEDDVQRILHAIQRIWDEDPSESAGELRRQAGAADRSDAAGQWRTLLPYIDLLMARDQKLTPLKDLQGMIWNQGYGNGDLIGPLFDDVAPALRRWRQQGLSLAVYSSGSIAAQKLIYQHSSAGDLRGLFSHWYDTRIGSKLAAESYAAISAAMRTDPQRILFISDSGRELQAAREAQLPCLCSQRPGNPQGCVEGFPAIESFEQISLNGEALPA